MKNEELKKTKGLKSLHKININMEVDINEGE